MEKIVIVMSDGASDDSSRVQKTLSDLRAKNVAVVEVGITSGGAAVLNTYAPDALVCGKTEDLPGVLWELLKKEIKGLNS